MCMDTRFMHLSQGQIVLCYWLPSIRDPCICNPSSDHFAVFTRLNTAKLQKKHETVSFRKYKDIDVSEFKSDIQNSGLNSCSGYVEEIVDIYNTELKSLIVSIHRCKRNKLQLDSTVNGICNIQIYE